MVGDDGTLLSLTIAGGVRMPLIPAGNFGGVPTLAPWFIDRTYLIFFSLVVHSRWLTDRTR